MIIIELLYNLSILVALSVLSGFIDNRYHRNKLSGKVIQGLLFGITAVIGMMNPFVFSPGVIFDGRSIVISLCTLFFGPVSGLISSVISIIYRIHLGGGGALMGVSVILSSFLIGFAFSKNRYFFGLNTDENVKLYLLGVLTHVAMLILVLLLPKEIILKTYQQITITVIGIYPVITVLIGKILSDQEKNKNYITELSEREKLLRTTLYSLSEGVITTDLSGCIQSMNRVAEQLTGWNETEAKGMNYTSVCVFENHDSDKDNNPISVVLRGGEYKKDGLPKVLISKSGQKISISYNCAPILRDDESMVGVVFVFNDISAKVELDQKLQESEYRYQKLAEISPVGIFRTDKDGLTTYVNNQWTKISGLPAVEALDYGWMKAVHPDDCPALRRRWDDDTLQSHESHAEYRFIRPDGKTAWVIGRAVPELNHKNEIVGYVGTITDITEMKETEEALRQSEEIFKQFMKYSPVYVFFKDKDVRSIRLSENYEKMLNKPLEELLNKNMFELFPSDLAKSMVEDDRKILEDGKVIEVEEQFNERFFRTIKFPIHKDGKPQYLAGFTLDITDQKKMMSELLLEKEKAEKANQLKSEFLAQMSHEIRSPINTIVNFTSLIETEFKEGDTADLDTCFEGINLASRRVIRTIDSILNMSELQLGTYESNIREMNIAEVIKNLINEYRSSAERKKLKISFINESSETEINTDEYAINQILANLIDNAIKYTKKGYVTIELTENDKTKMKIAVSDTGKGISDEYLPYLFDPFTQEEQGYTRRFDGNGLGMSLVKKYCELIKAEIYVESKLGVGTTFTIILPVSIG